MIEESSYQSKKNDIFGCFSIYNRKWPNSTIKKYIFTKVIGINKYITAAWFVQQLKNLSWPTTFTTGFICGGYLSSIKIDFDPKMSVEKWIEYCTFLTEIKNIDNVILNNQINFENLQGDLRIINLRTVAISTLKKIKLSLFPCNCRLEIFYNTNYYKIHDVRKLCKEMENIIVLLYKVKGNLADIICRLKHCSS